MADAELNFKEALTSEGVPLTTVNGIYCLVLPTDVDHAGRWFRADHPESGGIWVAQALQKVKSREDGDVYTMWDWSGPHYS